MKLEVIEMCLASFKVRSCLGKLPLKCIVYVRFESCLVYLVKCCQLTTKYGYMWLKGAVCSGKSLNLTLFSISLYDNLLWLINWWNELVVGWFEDNIMSVWGLVCTVKVRRETGLWINRNRVDCEAMCGLLCWIDMIDMKCLNVIYVIYVLKCLDCIMCIRVSF